MGVPEIVGVALLGGTGALARHALSAAVALSIKNSALPWGTLTVNLIGSFALGVLAASDADQAVLMLVGGALLGSFTTFSALALELTELPRHDAAAYLIASLALGLACVWLGHTIAG